MKKATFAVLGILLAACSEQDATTLAGAASAPELGQTEQELIPVGSFDPQNKHGVFREQGPFHQTVPEFGTATFPFGAYVYWQGNRFALVAALGSINVDLTAEDATTFPAANPAQPIMYEYSEDPNCSWAPLRLTCEGTGHALFTPPGVGPVTVPLDWTMTKYPGDPFYVFHGAIEGESTDAFNYPVFGAECETALARIADFFEAADVEFSVLDLDPEVCDP